MGCEDCEKFSPVGRTEDGAAGDDDVDALLLIMPERTLFVLGGMGTFWRTD